VDKWDRLLGGLLVRRLDACCSVFPRGVERPRVGPWGQAASLSPLQCGTSWQLVPTTGGRKVTAEIIVVSGLPRSGTSLMMQMLESGGVEVATDNVRAADADTPRGYYELEKVKKLEHDSSWLPPTRGKAFKMVSQLLYPLPAGERYRIIFMERDMEEMLLSQEKMLERLNRPAAPREAIRRSFTLHLERLREWLGQQGNMEVIRVSYNDLLRRPQEQAERVSAFLGGRVDVERMALTVDPALYRNRKAPGQPAG